MRARLREGGLLMITMRDFDTAVVEKPPLGPTAVVPGPPRRVLVRLHDWDDDHYTVRYVVLTEAQDGWTVADHTTRYRAITLAELTLALEAARFHPVPSPAERVVGDQQVIVAFAT